MHCQISIFEIKMMVKIGVILSNSVIKLQWVTPQDFWYKVNVYYKYGIFEEKMYLRSRSPFRSIWLLSWDKEKPQAMKTLGTKAVQSWNLQDLRARASSKNQKKNQSKHFSFFNKIGQNVSFCYQSCSDQLWEKIDLMT